MVCREGIKVAAEKRAIEKSDLTLDGGVLVTRGNPTLLEVSREVVTPIKKFDLWKAVQICLANCSPRI